MILLQGLELVFRNTDGHPTADGRTHRRANRNSYLDEVDWKIRKKSDVIYEWHLTRVSQRQSRRILLLIEVRSDFSNPTNLTAVIYGFPPKARQFFCLFGQK